MKTILVVDDEPGSAEVLSLILAEDGYRTHCAVNGRDALAMARDVRPDLVIVDFMMPMMNGGDFVRGLRADPAAAGIRVILNSGLPESAIREKFTDYDVFLRKPFNIDTLLGLVRRLLAEDTA